MNLRPASLALLMLSPAAFAGDTSVAKEAKASPPLTLMAVVADALAGNPNLLATRAKWEAMKNRPAQAGAPANPMFTVRGMDMADGGDFPDANEKQYAIEQPLTGFGKGRLRRQAADYEAQGMEFEFETLALDLTRDVKETYHGLWSARQARDIVRDETNVLARLEAVAQTVYAAGQSSQTDVLKAQTELTMLEPRLLDLDAQIGNLESKLNVLMGRAVDGPIEIAPPPELPDPKGRADELLGIAEQNRPEIKRAAAGLAQARTERTRMGRESLPDYRLGFEYRTFRDNEPDMAMFMVSVELPIWRGKFRAGIREADQMVVSGQAALDAARQQADLDARQAWFDAQTAQKTAHLYRNTLIPQAQTRFEASEAGYRTGRVDFMDVLESERFLLEARVMAAMAEGEAGMQAARLERALGGNAGEAIIPAPNEQKE